MYPEFFICCDAGTSRFKLVEPGNTPPDGFRMMLRGTEADCAHMLKLLARGRSLSKMNSERRRHERRKQN